MEAVSSSLFVGMLCARAFTHIDCVRHAYSPAGVIRLMTSLWLEYLYVVQLKRPMHSECARRISVSMRVCVLWFVLWYVCSVTDAGAAVRNQYAAND